MALATQPPDGLLDIEMAAAFADVRPATVQGWITQGKLPVAVPGRRGRGHRALVRLRDVVDIMQSKAP